MSSNSVIIDRDSVKMERGRTHVSYQTNPNFCERIGSSLAGILVGIVFLVLATGLVFWNEVKLLNYVVCF